MIRNERSAAAEAGEPIHDEDMSVYDNGGTLVVGVTSFARKYHRLTKHDTVTVEVHDGGIWIGVGSDD